MKFLRFDLGKVDAGKTVQVSLSGSIANVRLINNKNIYDYEHGHDYESTGGLADKALIDMKIPSKDHWFIVIDMEGLRGVEGKIDATVRVL